MLCLLCGAWTPAIFKEQLDFFENTIEMYAEAAFQKLEKYQDAKIIATTAIQDMQCFCNFIELGCAKIADGYGAAPLARTRGLVI